VETARTLVLAAQLLRASGATKVYALLTHGILSSTATTLINSSCIDKIVVTNTAPQEAHMAVLREKMDVVDIAPVFAEAIRRIYNGESVSNLWSLDYWTGAEIIEGR
jgi:ribose-phosphate pyrophosphokinase